MKGKDHKKQESRNTTDTAQIQTQGVQPGMEELTQEELTEEELQQVSGGWRNKTTGENVIWL